MRNDEQSYEKKYQDNTFERYKKGKYSKTFEFSEDTTSEIQGFQKFNEFFIYVGFNSPKD